MTKANKRGNSEGSIYFDKSVGLYRSSITLPDGRRKSAGSAKTRKEAAGKLAALQTQLAAGIPAASTDRLDAFLNWWLTTLEAKAASGTKSVITVDNAKWAITKWILPHMGSIRLRELEPENVEKMLAAMVAAGRARSSVIRVRSILGQALAVAQRRGKVARNVARLSEMPATSPPPRGGP